MQGHQQFCFTRNYHFISFCLSFINCKVSLMKSSCKFVLGLPWWLNDEESACQCRRPRFSPWVGKIPWRRQWQLNPVFLPGKSHGQRSLVGYRPQGRKESGKTERPHFHPAYGFPLAAVSPTIVYCLCLASWSLTMSRWKVHI